MKITSVDEVEGGTVRAIGTYVPTYIPDWTATHIDRPLRVLEAYAGAFNARESTGYRGTAFGVRNICFDAARFRRIEVSI